MLSSIFTYYLGQVSAVRVRLKELVVAGAEAPSSSSPGGCCSSAYSRPRHLAAGKLGRCGFFARFSETTVRRGRIELACRIGSPKLFVVAYKHVTDNLYRTI